MVEPELKENLLKAVDSLKDDLIKLTCDLVKIPSVNPNYPGEVYEEILGGETDVASFLRPILEEIGLETDMWEEEKGRANLVGVYKGTGGGRSLILCGHTDVVPPGPEGDWTKASPWSGKTMENKIWGRGSCDMKGGDAAACLALKAVINAGYKPKGDVIIEYVVGEEMMNHEVGVDAAIKRGYKADGAIVCEPSAPPYRVAIAPASPGLLHMRVTIEGKAGHVSQRDELIRAGGRGAEVGVNSIDKAMIIYEGLRKLEEEWGQTKVHPVFTRPGHFVIHPGVITGGPQGPYVISSESKIEYAIFYPPHDSDEQVKREIQEQVTRFAQTDPWLRQHPPKVEWLLWWPPYDVPIDAPIFKAVATAYELAMGEPVKYYGFAGCNDGAFLNRAGIPTVVIGPGDIGVAHAANEHVEIADLVDAAKIYALSIAEWCGVERAST